MHIVFVTETWPPEVNGVAFTVQTLCRGMAARGHRVEVVRPGADGRDGNIELISALGVPLMHYPGLQVGMPKGAALRKQWQMQRPDVVYIATEGPLGGSAMRSANALRIPVVTGFHTRLDDYTRHYGLGLLAPWVRSRLLSFHRRAQMTLVPTCVLVEELTDAGITHVHKLRRGVDTELFSPKRRDYGLRVQWGAHAHAPVLMCVGRIAAEKNLELALQAFRSLRTLITDARMVMVGDGPQRAALASAYPDVLFVGTKHGEELAAHYASADLFLFPSQTETFGNVVLEAMSSGLAAVSFDLAAAREHIANGISGLAVPATDPQGFIRVACELGRDIETRRMLGTNARIAAQHCAHHAVTADFARLLLTLPSEHDHDPVNAAAA